MITQEAAFQIVEKLVAEMSTSDLELVTFREPLRFGDYGWVFGYQSVKYLRTGDIHDLLFGNAPYLLERASGKVHRLGTAYDIETYIANFLASGDPHKMT